VNLHDLVEMGMKLGSVRRSLDMKTNAANGLKNGAKCKVIGGTHEGKSGTMKDIKTGKTGLKAVQDRNSHGDTNLGRRKMKLLFEHRQAAEL
jgi:hypothetical protein